MKMEGDLYFRACKHCGPKISVGGAYQEAAQKKDSDNTGTALLRRLSMKLPAGGALCYTSVRVYQQFRVRNKPPLSATALVELRQQSRR